MLSAAAREILALCTLAAIGSFFAGWVVLKLRRSPFSPAQSALYALNYVLTRILWRVQIRGRFPIAADQGAVLDLQPSLPGRSGIHRPDRSARDPLDGGTRILRTPRVPRFAATVWSIPVGRGGIDTAATKAAIRIVEQGGLVGLFPEGQINTTDQLLLPGRSGAAMIALRGKVPVVPCYIHGAPYDGTTLGCLLMPASVRLTIGEPIDLSDYFGRDNDREVLGELTRRFLRDIAQLAGDNDFQPKLAGRPYWGQSTLSQ